MIVIDLIRTRIIVKKMELKNPLFQGNIKHDANKYILLGRHIHP